MCKVFIVLDVRDETESKYPSIVFLSMILPLIPVGIGEGAVNYM